MDTVDVVEKMARTQDLNGNVVQTKELVKDKSALHVLFSPDSIDSRGDLKEEGKQAMQELVEMHDLTNPKKLGNFWYNCISHRSSTSTSVLNYWKTYI